MKKHTFFQQAALILVSVVLTLAAGEILIRLIYWDGGRRISGAPGNKRFEYLFSPEGRRGPTANHPKAPGVNRILVQGDSITFGAGVRDWKDLYPYRLLRLVNKPGITFDMETLAGAGWEIDAHRANLSQVGRCFHSDIIIYQWYVNDLEIHKGGRPVNRSLFWRDLPSHETLMNVSYLYNFLDKRLENVLPSSGRTYTQYLVDDYAEKTPGWFLFRLEFHNWATLAKVCASRRILMLYPSLPYQGEYPLKPIHDRVAGLSKAQDLTLPAIWSDKGVGGEVKEPDSPWGASLQVKQGKAPAGIVFLTPPIYLEEGNHLAIVRFQRSRPDHQGSFKLKVMAGGRLVTEKTLVSQDGIKEGPWQEIQLPFSLKMSAEDDIQFQVDYSGYGNFKFDSIHLPVEYGLEVLDLLPYLKDIHTHVSPFDAHPNPKAHQIMAEALYRHLNKTRPLRSGYCGKLPSPKPED